MARAVYRNARISPYKVRLLANRIRAATVSEAIDQLAFSPQKAAALLRKVLESAVDNAEKNENADVDLLQVESIQVDQGPVMKRLRPRARGRADRILKRSSHITVVVSESSQAG